MTDYGEVGPKSAELLEWIVNQFQLKSESDGSGRMVVRSPRCVEGLSKAALC